MESRLFHLRALLLLLAVLFLPFTAMSVPQQGHSEPPTPNCMDCHTCKNPTPEDMCLKPCPTLRLAHTSRKAPHDIKEAPEKMLLDDIADLYQPVKFNHKIHANMALMGNTCSTCHHFSPAGKIPPCKDCHTKTASETDLRQPGLKGAYHRQCLGCHREWSHDTQCVLCHLPAEGKKQGSSTPDKSDIMGMSHPKLTEPDVKVYTTPYKPGAIVTFHHKEHIEVFGLKCVNCHMKENCSYCHDLAKPASSRKSMKEVHAVCSENCHATDNCGKCHDSKEKPGFAHDATGWPLNKFHVKLDCRACHPTGRKIARLSNDCSACHQNWKPGEFKHAVVGLMLDDTHSEMDCESCHVDKKFGKRPSCEACHDDQRDFKKTPPGQFTMK